MKFLNPKITVQNTDTDLLHVTVEHQFSEAECIVITVGVDRSAQTLLEIQRKAVMRSLELLTLLQGSLDESK